LTSNSPTLAASASVRRPPPPSVPHPPQCPSGHRVSSCSLPPAPVALAQAAPFPALFAPLLARPSALAWQRPSNPLPLRGQPPLREIRLLYRGLRLPAIPPAFVCCRRIPACPPGRTCFPFASARLARSKPDADRHCVAYLNGRGHCVATCTPPCPASPGYPSTPSPSPPTPFLVPTQIYSNNKLATVSAPSLTSVGGRVQVSTHAACAVASPPPCPPMPMMPLSSDFPPTRPRALPPALSTHACFVLPCAASLSSSPLAGPSACPP
jgi:hypothetical protein